MNIAIAMAQFVMLALAAMASRILVNSGSVVSGAGGLSDTAAYYMAHYGLWALVIPGVWLMFASWCAKKGSGALQMAQSLGAGITVAILAGIVFVLAF